MSAQWLWWWTNKPIWKIWQRFQRGLVRQMFSEFNESESCLPLDQSQCLLELTDVDGEGSVKHLPQKFRQNEGWNCDLGRVKSKGVSRLDHHSFQVIGPLTDLSPALTKMSEILNAAVFTACQGQNQMKENKRFVLIFACEMVRKLLS